MGEFQVSEVVVHTAYQARTVKLKKKKKNDRDVDKIVIIIMSDI